MIILLPQYDTQGARIRECGLVKVLESCLFGLLLFWDLWSLGLLHIATLETNYSRTAFPCTLDGVMV